MYSLTTTVINPSGLHARPATVFVEQAKKFASDIFIKNATIDGVKKNAKSVISIISLAAIVGTEVEISAEGEDAEEAVSSLIKLIDSGLGE